MKLLLTLALAVPMFAQWSEPIIQGPVTLSLHRYEVQRTQHLCIVVATTTEETDAFLVTVRFNNHGKQRRTYTVFRAKSQPVGLYSIPSAIDIVMPAPVYAITVEEVVFSIGETHGFEIQDRYGDTAR